MQAVKDKEADLRVQGLISVISRGEVRLKIIVGNNGERVKFLADVIREMGYVPSLAVAYDLATAQGFSTADGLVVIDPVGVKYLGADPLNPRYRQTFNDPRLNPRGDRGSDDHVEVIRFEPHF